MSFYIADAGFHLNNGLHPSLQATMAQFFESLFLSELSGDVPPTDVGRIVRVSRANSAAENLSGLMLFDGERFCHYLEGTEAAVRQQANEISRDSRYVGVQQLHQGPAGNSRRFGIWQVGFLAPDGPSPLLALSNVRDKAAINALFHLLREKDTLGIHVV